MVSTTAAPEAEMAGRGWALTLSTVAFTVCFAVWTIFSIIGVEIQQELQLSETQFGLLIGTPILTGSLMRLVVGVWAEQIGGRLVMGLMMLLSAIATILLIYAHDYPTYLFAALGVGIAGGTFAAGVVYVSHWYPKSRQGTALGIFGMGNVGAAVTKFLAPTIMVGYGWHTVAIVWAGVIGAMGLFFLIFAKEDPQSVARRAAAKQPEPFLAQLAPLARLQVWRFALYYLFVFGAFVALSLWLPRYLIGVYGFDIRTAGMIAAAFSIPASIFRAYGGVLADRYGARRLMYWTFLAAIACTFLLSYPPTDYSVSGIHGKLNFHVETDATFFIVLIFILGFFMSLGKAAVYKHIPVYYPDKVGAVGGLVGAVGGLGGFVLPILFGVLNDITGIWQSCFMILFLITGIALTWMHVSIRRMERAAVGAALDRLPALPEMQEVHGKQQEGALTAHVVLDWRPDDPVFWESNGRKIARRNLWLSIPSLFLSFAVWMVWSVVVAKLPAAGFHFSTDQLFWLAAMPGLSGACLRVFYAFMVPVFGGRLWTTLTTWSLVIPALGIGLAVQNPDTPYFILLALATLCGFGGGNFASSMANISFFFPKSEKGNALALNAGLGNLGVSAVQFAVPLVITSGVFGWLGGDPHTGGPAPIWLQNAGFIWVPLIVASAFAAWFGMDDLSTAKSSFAEQSAIFQRNHNWVMCWLYTGTFGSFIGYSAGFPLLINTQFPAVDGLAFAFLGPLVGALSRSGTGWIADRFGGGRVTFWVFIVMAIAASGVIYFLSIRTQPGAFWGFFAMFMILFLVSGIGNASTFQMVPVIMRTEIARLHPGVDEATRTRQAEKESAAIIGFSSAVAAFGAFFIPKAYGSAIALTGGPAAALYAFLAFYVVSAAVTWFFYTRRNAPVPC
jgi:NNP family nitrate/nitrite transporter-like MFS transporter